MKMQKHLEARRKKRCLEEQDVVPGGFHLGFIRGQVCPVWPPRSQPCSMAWWQNSHVPLDLPSAVSFAASGMKGRQWEEQQEASSALTFHSAMQRNTKGGVMRWPAVLCGREHLFQLSMSALCEVSGVSVHTPQYPTYVNIDQLNAQNCYVIGAAYSTQQIIAGCCIQPTNQGSGKPQYFGCGPWEWF